MDDPRLTRFRELRGWRRLLYIFPIYVYRNVGHLHVGKSDRLRAGFSRQPTRTIVKPRPRRSADAGCRDVYHVVHHVSFYNQPFVVPFLLVVWFCSTRAGPMKTDSSTRINNKQRHSNGALPCPQDAAFLRRFGPIKAMRSCDASNRPMRYDALNRTTRRVLMTFVLMTLWWLGFRPLHQLQKGAIDLTNSIWAIASFPPENFKSSNKMHRNVDRWRWNKNWKQIQFCANRFGKIICS